LLQRERLGTTAVGDGVAIPHGKLPKLEKLFGLFARLERPIDFEAMDGQPVDLVFLLLAPEGAGADHLKALARIARLLRDLDVAKKLRASRDAQLRCIDLDNGDAWSQSLGLDFGDILTGPQSMPALSDSTVAIAYGSHVNQSVSMSISFFDVRTGALGGRRDMLPNGRDVPQLVPLGDTLLVRTRNTLEILK
jgi:hypothetical protein